MKHIIPILIVLLLLSSGFVGISNTAEVDSEQKSTDEGYAYNRFNEHDYPEGYLFGQNTPREYDDVVSSEIVIKNEEETVTGNKFYKPQQTATLSGPMDSPWPMFMHDVRHTGRSPYSTADNPYDEKWYFTAEEWEMGSPVIDNEGVVYFCPEYLYAIYPNGSLKWKYEDWYGTVAHAAPAIDENGTIYVGVAYNSINSKNFYAFYPNGTVKWIYPAGGNIFSSPVIGGDDSVYFAAGKYFYGVYPNGTLKWKYKAGDYFWGSSPAIGLDGTVYCGAHDDYVYAWYPNNGTVKWKLNTGAWVHASPTIGDNGTVYIIGGDRNLYALYPDNGTEIWRQKVGYVWGSPTLGVDGTIYVGVFEEKFYAIYPNGTIKWTFNAGGRIWFGSSAAISADGTIYFGATPAMGGHGSDFIALNPNGTEKWRYSPGWYESSPAIGDDGTVYIVSSHRGYGRLHAFGELDSNAPDVPAISGRTSGKAGKEYEYKFTTTDPNGDDVYYYIEWGDGAVENWIGPYGSGEKITVSHTWDEKGNYTIKARAKDTYNLWGPWGEFEVTMPMNQQMWFLRWLERFPRLQWLLDILGRYVG